MKKYLLVMLLFFGLASTVHAVQYVPVVVWQPVWYSYNGYLYYRLYPVYYVVPVPSLQGVWGWRR